MFPTGIQWTQLTSSPKPFLNPTLTWIGLGRSTPRHPMPISLEGKVEVEGPGPSPLRSLQISLHTPFPHSPDCPDCQQQPEPLPGRQLKAAVPSPLSSPWPISGSRAPLGLPLPPGSSKCARSRSELWHCLQA